MEAHCRSVRWKALDRVVVVLVAITFIALLTAGSSLREPRHARVALRLGLLLRLGLGLWLGLGLGLWLGLWLGLGLGLCPSLLRLRILFDLDHHHSRPETRARLAVSRDLASP